MTWLWVAVVVAVLGVVIAIVVGRISGGAMPEVAPDRPAAQLTSAPLTDADLAGIRFTQTLRGYAMDEVDDFIERLRAELSARPRLDELPPPTGDVAEAAQPVEPASVKPASVDQLVEPASVDAASVELDARP